MPAITSVCAHMLESVELSMLRWKGWDGKITCRKARSAPEFQWNGTFPRKHLAVVTRGIIQDFFASLCLAIIRANSPAFDTSKQIKESTVVSWTFAITDPIQWQSPPQTSPYCFAICNVRGRKSHRSFPHELSSLLCSWFYVSVTHCRRCRWP